MKHIVESGFEKKLASVVSGNVTDKPLFHIVAVRGNLIILQEDIRCISN